MAMGATTHPSFHIPTFSRSSTFTPSSSLLTTLPSLHLTPLSSSSSSHSRSFASRAFLQTPFPAHSQAKELLVSRVMASDATATEPEADEGVEYTAAEALTMYIRMEGTLGDSAGFKVSKSLEGMEGVSNVKVSLEEGMATVELTKKTNIQATGVASELVEAAQKAGFKLQSLSLGFDDEETGEDDALYFGSSSVVDEAEIAAV